MEAQEVKYLLKVIQLVNGRAEMNWAVWLQSPCSWSFCSSWDVVWQEVSRLRMGTLWMGCDFEV